MFHQKHTQMPGKGRTDRKSSASRMYPYSWPRPGAFFFFISACWPCWAASLRSTRSGCTARTPRWPCPRTRSRNTWACSKARCASPELGVEHRGPHDFLERADPGAGAARPPVSPARVPFGTLDHGRSARASRQRPAAHAATRTRIRHRGHHLVRVMWLEGHDVSPTTSISRSSSPRRSPIRGGHRPIVAYFVTKADLPRSAA